MGPHQSASGADTPRASSSGTPSPTHGSHAADPAVTARALIARTCTGPPQANTANTNSSPTAAAAAAHSRGWRPRLPFSPRSNSLGASSAGGTPRSSGSLSRHVSAQGLSSAASTASQQALLSFPVDDIDPYQEEVWLQDSQPGSPRSWPMHDDSPGPAAAAAGAGTSRQRAGGTSRSRSRDKQGGDRRRSSGVYASTHAAVQAIVGGAVCMLQQLAVPWGGLLDQEGLRPGG